MPGPPRTPTKILEGRGSWRAKKRRGEVRPPAGRPIQPAGLAPAGRTIWKNLLAMLEQAGLLAQIDGYLLERYVRLYLRWRDAERRLAREGQVLDFQTREGVLVRRRNPLTSISRELHAELLKVERQFGMSPAARAGLDVQAPPVTGAASGESPFAKRA